MVLRLCGGGGGYVALIVFWLWSVVFIQLHRAGFTLESKTLFESILQVVADAGQGKISCYFKTAILLFSNHVKIK